MADIASSVPLPSPAVSHTDSSGFDWKDYGKRGAAATLHFRTRERAQCERCRRWFAAIGISKHLNVCLRNEPPPPFINKPPRCHDKCECGAMKCSKARTCFSCEGRDEKVFACLNVLIEAGIDTPREKLAANGAPVDDPKALLLWVSGWRMGTL